jgi:hypothetical protein
MDPNIIKEFQKRLELKVRENEIAVIEHWKERLDRLIAMRPDGIASLQAEMKKLSEMMKNRVTALKRSAD